MTLLFDFITGRVLVREPGGAWMPAPPVIVIEGQPSPPV